MMKPTVYRITLDVHDEAAQILIKMKRGDTARRLIIALVEDGIPYEPTSDCIAVFNAKKADGTVIYGNCEIIDGRVIFDTTAQATAVCGIVDCELTLYGADDMQLTAARFGIMVIDTVTNEDDIVSSDEFSALTALMSDIGETLDNTATPEAVAELYEAAKSAEATASTAAQAATAAAQAAEKAASEATAAAGGGVTSFNGRSGAVKPQYGDYTAEMVGADAAGAATTAVNAHNTATGAHDGVLAKAPKTYTVPVYTTSWTSDSANGGYYNTVAVSGMLATDDPLADVVLGTDIDANALYLEAWALVTRITTGANTVTLWANGDAPTCTFTVQLKVVR